MHLQLQNWLQSSNERSLSSVPWPLKIVLLVALLSQLGWHYLQEEPVARAETLTEPPPRELLEVLALGDPETLSRLLMLRMQAFDNQPGISIPFQELDYQRLTNWLEAIALLDLNSQYPYLSAARVYAKVQDEARKRTMLDFVHRGFLRRPNLQWPAMAHAVFIAKHRLQDLELALAYARDIRKHVTDPNVQSWVRQMELFVLEDLGDLESARILLGAFLESGVIKNEQEFNFLKQRLGLTD